MKALRLVLFGGLLTAAALTCTPAESRALAFRQYYGGWTHYNSGNYYYRYYYYKPYPTYSGYYYQHCYYYPSYPNYVYYYNPYRQVYWGRFDLTAKDENKYSLLAEKDCKKDLKDIPESAFPKPGKMPAIPGAEDKEAMEPLPDDLPKK